MRILKKEKSNLVPIIVSLGIVLAICLLMFLFHPSSPYHKRYQFVIRYETIGTLSVGNRVEVRGITKGSITKVELTEDAVYVTAQVLADTKIPVNSEFRLKTAGLMGERELSVLTGDSKNLISDGDTLWGNFEDGANAIGRNLKEILTSLDSMSQELKQFKESVVTPQEKQFAQIKNKADNLIEITKQSEEKWVGGIKDVLSNCENSLKNAKSLVTKLPKQAENSVQNVKNLLEKVNVLEQKFKELNKELELLDAKIKEDTNTLGLILTQKESILKELELIKTDTEALIQDIYKEGLKLNVDIF